MHDVAIIGGGLSGSFSALNLARQGLKVVVLEEHALSGEPRYCTGIIGQEAFTRFKLPLLPIQNSFSSAILHSPLGATVRLTHTEPQAFVINRALFDWALAERASSVGAEYRFNTKCVALEPASGRVVLTVQNGLKKEKIYAHTAILAAGTWYGLHTPLGLSRPKRLLDTAQVEVNADRISEVEVYFGRKVAPGSFGWAVPLEPGRARIGVSTYKNAGYYLVKLLESKAFLERIPGGQPMEIKRKVIPISPIKKTFGPRFLITGDSAGQVKPTTGGGIYYALLSAHLASENIISAFKTGDFSETHFSRYQAAWQKEIGMELRIGNIARKILSVLPDSKIDSLVRTLKDEDIMALIQKNANFDWHQKIITGLAAHPRVLFQLSQNLFSIRKTLFPARIAS